MDGWAINSIVTLIVIPVCGWYLARLVKRKEILEEERRLDWQKGAVERYDGLVVRFDRIERCMGQIKGTMNDKLDIDTYAHHEHLIDCDSKACSVRRTSGVII